MAVHDESVQERHLREVDRALLYVAEARIKAEEIASALEKEGAEERFVSALRTTAAAMSAEHKRLMNATFYSVPAEPKHEQQERMAV